MRHLHTRSFRTAKLRLNGNDRFYERDASYFRLLQPLNCGLKVPTKHIYSYSFCLNLKNFNRVVHVTFQELTMLN